jgi:hypothetical protein
MLIFFNSHSGGDWSLYWVHSARRPLNGLLYLARVIMLLENLVEWRLAGETEVPGENLPQRHFVHHKSNLPHPGSKPGRRSGKPATNRLSYGAALVIILSVCHDCRLQWPRGLTHELSSPAPTLR